MKKRMNNRMISSAKKQTNKRTKNTQQAEESNVEHSDSVKVTGHRSVQSQDDYEEAEEKEQRWLPLTISKRNYENPCAEKKRIADSDITVAPLAPVTMNVPFITDNSRPIDGSETFC